jgi:hypothetical protein
MFLRVLIAGKQAIGKDEYANADRTYFVQPVGDSGEAQARSATEDRRDHPHAGHWR